MLRITLVTLVLAAACGDGTDSNPPPPDMAPSCPANGLPPAAAGDLVVTGAVAATAPSCAPEAGRVYGIWSGQGPKGDYIFQYGEGSATRAGFSLGLAAAIPGEATFGNAFGVGVIALVDAATPIAPGIVDEAAFERDVRGLAGQFAIVYRGPNAGAPDWVAAFPAGLSCGKCVKAKDGGFDTFAPVACSEVVLEVGDEDSLDICNWI
jgi:hypothetical protein